MAKIPVYRKDTGEKVYVPEHWVGHKTLGKQFRKTPPPAPAPAVNTQAPATGDNPPKEK